MTISIVRSGRGWVLTTRTAIPRPVGEVFPFFADARNLDRITPRSVGFRILTPGEIEMRAGAVIDYRIRVWRAPVAWRTEITEWDPPRSFVDEQVRGPSLWWRHRHVLEDRGEGTEMLDEVRYGVPGGALVHGLFVRRELVRIFAFRAARIGEILAG